MGLLQYASMFRFYYGIDPDTLTDEKFIQLKNELDFMLNFEGKRGSTYGSFNMPMI